MVKKIKTYVAGHKFISTVVVILLAIGGYYSYRGTGTQATVTKYVVQKAALGTVVASVSGSGQVEPGTSIDIKAQNSETVTSIPVKVGQHVASGQLLVQLDATNEAKAVKQAQLNLQSAQLSLAKLQQISTTTLLQSQDAVTKGEQSIVDASTSLETDYQSGFDTLGSSFVDFQNVMTGLQNFVVGTDINKSQANPDAYVNLMPNYLQAGASPYRAAIQTTFAAASQAYQKNLADYHAATRNSGPATLDALFSETYNTAKLIGDAVKSGKDLLNFVVNNYPSASSSTNPLPPITNTFQTNFSNYTNTTNGDVTSLGNISTGITNDKNAIVNNARSLQEASETLAELVGGPTQLDLLGQQISIENAQNSLDTAQQNLAYDSIRAPIAGVVSAMDAVVGETVTSPAASIVGDGELGVITLNEVDAAKVVAGDPATLTFDAIDGLSLAGQVAEIDPVGTVSQGVVNYTAKISFSQPADTSSSQQVKPGMSVTADIVTQVSQDVIAVPNAAVKTQGTTSYVLEPATSLSDADITASGNGGTVLPGTKMVPVTVGLTNDTVTEITSGINVGDEIITQSIQSTAAATAGSTGGTNAFRALGGAAGGFGGGAGGGAVRVGAGGGGAATGR